MDSLVSFEEEIYFFRALLQIDENSGRLFGFAVVIKHNSWKWVGYGKSAKKILVSFTEEPYPNRTSEK